MTKFNNGDKIVLNGRTPKELLAEVRVNRKRTITSIYYDPDKQCRYFYLGVNHQGAAANIECYPFRSYMLDAVIARGPGRPRTKRKYTRHIERRIMNKPIKCPFKQMERVCPLCVIDCEHKRKYTRHNQ